MNVKIVVPRRADNGPRDRLWEFCRPRWKQAFPDWPIIEGHHTDGQLFNRAAAVNDAVEQAGDFDVVLIIDADTVSNAEAVANAVELAALTGQFVVAHDERVMLTPQATAKVLAGFDGSWRQRGFVQRVWTDSVSSAVALSRQLWDAVGGFDETFDGWGGEDSAFRCAAEYVTGKPPIFLGSECFHLHHPPQHDQKPNSPSHRANLARRDLYAAARYDGAMDILLAEARAIRASRKVTRATRIPRILHRTVPETTSDEVEAWWRRFAELHPGWELRTYREPIDPADWPLTGDLFDRCQNGAQKAGLIRLECLWRDGGVYVDSDVEPFRSFESLLQLEAFAGWEDETTVPDAVLGAIAEHPAFELMLQKARAVIEGGGDAWQSGPGVTTEVLPGRPDVLLLPPGAFYPAHYLEKHNLGTRTDAPYVFCEHKWHHSWGTPSQRQSIEQRQRA